MSERFAVMGAGEVGFHLANTLSQEGHSVVVIERDPVKRERVEEALDGLVARYRNAVLNDLPEFAGSNTGVEIFARVLVEAMSASLEGEPLSAVEVRLWESEEAWASCRRELP